MAEDFPPLPSVSGEDQPGVVIDVTEQIHALLRGHEPGFQSAVIADLTARLITGHHPAIREDVRRMHNRLVEHLCEVNELLFSCDRIERIARRISHQHSRGVADDLKSSRLRHCRQHESEARPLASPGLGAAARHALDLDAVPPLQGFREAHKVNLAAHRARYGF